MNPSQAELFPGPPRTEMQREATISDDGRYRYDLTRRWGEGPTFTWVMLNPSTADASTDDPTLRMVMGYSHAAGAGRAVVVNLFAYRTPFPRDLFKAHDPIGPDNDAFVRLWATNADRVVLAWGAEAQVRKWAHRGRAAAVLDQLRQWRPEGLWCVERTATGQPRHPLYTKVANGLVAYP